MHTSEHVFLVCIRKIRVQLNGFLVGSDSRFPIPGLAGDFALVKFCACGGASGILIVGRSEEHTSELQSQPNIVCRLLLGKKRSRYWVSTTDSPICSARCASRRCASSASRCLCGVRWDSGIRTLCETCSALCHRLRFSVHI